MKKVFIIHGFEGSPNGGWRPWLMAELGKADIYACALAMPRPDAPICREWIAEIARHCIQSTHDEIYLVGHSLGVPAILRYLETATAQPIAGAVLVSGPSEKTDNRAIDTFLEKSFDFERVRKNCGKMFVIHGDNDPLVPIKDAEFLSEKLKADLIIVKNGGHLNGSSGWLALPQCLEALQRLMGRKIKVPI
ncbi:alpha/beta hydrolase [Patescibacteria group bacterium]|nr:alpha/beta hydrolase [Patescibacteria group bacterium]